MNRILHIIQVLLLSVFGMSKGFAFTPEKVEVKSFRYAGPYEVKAPVMMDSVDVNRKKFDMKQLMDAAVKMDGEGSAFEGVFAPVSSESAALHTLSFSMTNTSFGKAKINVEGLKQFKVFVDDKAVNGEQSYEPSKHKVVIKYLTEKSEKMDSLKVSVETEGKMQLDADETLGRPYTIYDVLLGERYSGVEISPNGKYVIFGKSDTKEGGRATTTRYVKEVTSGRIIEETSERISWMPRSNKYWFTRSGKAKNGKDGSRELIAVDPATRQQTVIACGVPNEYFVMSPTEDYLIVMTTQQGPKENPDVYEVREPDDRQPGWRNRSGLAKYDLKSGVMQPLTFGFHNVSLCDISQDGKFILIMKSESRLTQRPTTVFSIYRMNVETLAMETIVEKDGFIGNAVFTKDGRQIVLQGTPECLGGIGKNVREGQTPSMIDNQLYLYDIASKKIEPLTKTFNPNVQGVELSASDGLMYFTAEDKDCVHLYQLDVKSKKIRQIAEPEDVVMKISVASGSGDIAMYGQGALNSDRMYVLSGKNKTAKMIDDLSSERLEGIRIGECKPWTYVNAQGDSICCRYYLPADFDASKKYPMIVNYYGGCSPTGRNFESRYPHHAYAALGYIVLIVNPHGATGFGQEWSAAHVNTAGKGPAEDIIESTKAFCKDHAWVNDKKIGCIGASYGGFMTQYLQTVTDIFAAAISHAGISDHTSYWGYGYWGYSYSEVSMANSYPWTRKDLFVDQSPLFNADKVNTPLLFVHGDADTNVPVNESIQMYTALKLLGKETAMVLVKDQNHHILDYGKRIKWQNTIWAWFAKWLQDDSSWWESMYGEKAL